MDSKAWKIYFIILGLLIVIFSVTYVVERYHRTKIELNPNIIMENK